MLMFSKGSPLTHSRSVRDDVHHEAYSAIQRTVSEIPSANRTQVGVMSNSSPISQMSLALAAA